MSSLGNNVAIGGGMDDKRNERRETREDIEKQNDKEEAEINKLKASVIKTKEKPTREKNEERNQQRDQNNNVFSKNIMPSQLIKSKGEMAIINNNLRENYPYGNYLRHKKPAWITRIWLQNMNGLRYSQGTDKIKDIIQTMERLEIDVLATPETNTPWSKNLHATCTSIGRSCCGSFKVVGTSSDEPVIGKYQPGGVGIFARDRIVGRVNKAGVDNRGLGRWAFIRFGGKYNRNLWVIVGYRVCQTSEAGTETAYSQQVRILRRQGCENPKPREEWNKDMKKMLATIPKEDEVLLLADVNGKISDEDYANLLAESELYDLVTAKHNGDPPATYIRGTRAVDHAAGTKGVLEAVEEIGLVEFMKYFQSDHRGIYIDIFTKHIFTGVLHPLQRRDPRKVRTKSKARVTKFKERATEEIKSEDIVNQVKNITQATPTNQRCLVAKQLNKVYDKFHECLMNASESLYPYPVNWWTKEVQKNYKIKKYWEAAISFRRCKLQGTDVLEYLESQIPENTDIFQGDKTRSDYAQLRKAKKELDKARSNSYKDRQAMKKADVTKGINDNDPVKRIKKEERAYQGMLRKERRAGMFLKMKQYMKQGNQTALTHVDVPSENELWRWMMLIWHIKFEKKMPPEWILIFSITVTGEPWKEIVIRFGKYGPHKRVVDKESMDKHLVDHHKRHFSQAQGTPFTTEPLTKLFGETLETDFTKDFIEGRINVENIEGIDNQTKKFLKELIPKATDPPTIDTTVTAKQIKEGFKIWKESTSTSPKGNHLGLYKAWLNKYDDEKVLPQETFFWILENLLDLAIKYKQPFEYWSLIHNLFLCKQQGNYKIHRLRTLHIIDAMLNLTRREIITRRLMNNVESNNAMTDNQWGGRGGRSAIDVPTLKTFTLETFHLMRANAAFTDCDARACYDRVIAILTGLVQHKAGLPLNVCSFFIKALKQMRYHMSTAYGITKDANFHTTENPVHGSGQGATNGPPDWSLTSNVCLNRYSEEAHGCVIQDPTNEIKQQRDADMFVDDLTAQHNGGEYDKSEEELMEMTNHDINLWDSTLNIAGGLLETLKSGYSLLIWQFEEDGTPKIKEESQMEPNRVFLTREGGRIPIKRYSEKEGIKMIGVHKALNLQETSALEHIKKKTIIFARAINSCPLPRSEVIPAFMTIFLPSVAYIFPATTFTEMELLQLHKILLPKLLPRAGYKNNFPHAVALGPRTFLGIGIIHLKAYHLATQAETLIKNIRAAESVGNTAMIMLRWAQRSSGIQTPVLEDHGRLPHLEGAWIPNLRDGLITINAKLKMTNPWITKQQREKDEHIMERIRNDKYLTDQQVKQLNYCRMYLKVELLSDITTSDGSRLIQEVYTQSSGNQLTNQIQTTRWPRQEAPNLKAWKLWNKTLLRIYCKSGSTLKIPLGKWIRITKQWKFYYDQKNNHVYEYKDRQWRKHEHVTINRRTIEIHHESSQSGLPRSLIPITDMKQRQNSPFLIGSTPSEIKFRRKIKYTTFREYIDSLPQWEKVLLKTFRGYSNSYASLDEHLELGTELWFVTDGGVTGPLGYFGWVLATASQILWEGEGHSESNPELVESLRTESTGSLALGRFLLRRILFFGLSVTNVKNLIFCDNSTFQKRLERFFEGKKTKTNDYLLADMDVQMQVEETFSQINMNIQSKHVYGHQDTRQKKKEIEDQQDKPAQQTQRQQTTSNNKKEKTQKEEKLSWEAILNIRADELATKAYKNLYHKVSADRFHMLPAAKIYLFIEDKPITRNIKNEINKAWTTQDLRKHLNDKFTWKTSTASEIDWYACGSVLENTKEPSKARFIIRYTHERLEVNGTPFNLATTTTKCPYCEHLEETHDHFLTCSHNQEKWKDIIPSLVEIYNKFKIDPVIRILIFMALTNSSISETKKKHRDIDWKRYKQLIESQAAIGWKQVKYGRFSLEWHTMQQEYETDQVGKTDQGTPRWIRKVIGTIWNFAQNRWLARCNKQFGTSTSAYTIQRDFLYQKITNLYEQEEKLLLQDRHPFTKSLEYWKSANITAMKRWLHVQAPHIQFCLKLAHKQRKINAGDIRKFYKPNKPQDKPEHTNKQYERTKKRKKNKKIDIQMKDIRIAFKPVKTITTTRQKQQTTDTASGLTEYFSSQDRPPDNHKPMKIQKRIEDLW